MRQLPPEKVRCSHAASAGILLSPQAASKRWCLRVCGGLHIRFWEFRQVLSTGASASALTPQGRQSGLFYAPSRGRALPFLRRVLRIRMPRQRIRPSAQRRIGPPASSSVRPFVDPPTNPHTNPPAVSTAAAVLIGVGRTGAFFDGRTSCRKLSWIISLPSTLCLCYVYSGRYS